MLRVILGNVGNLTRQQMWHRKKWQCSHVIKHQKHLWMFSISKERGKCDICFKLILQDCRKPTWQANSCWDVSASVQMNLLFKHAERQGTSSYSSTVCTADATLQRCWQHKETSGADQSSEWRGQSGLWLKEQTCRETYSSGLHGDLLVRHCRFYRNLLFKERFSRWRNSWCQSTIHRMKKRINYHSFYLELVSCIWTLSHYLLDTKIMWIKELNGINLNYCVTQDAKSYSAVNKQAGKSIFRWSYPPLAWVILPFQKDTAGLKTVAATFTLHLHFAQRDKTF